MAGANLNDIAVFMAVADTGSFAAGARATSLTRSAAGKAVSRLEDRLGVRLLNRTTRALSLTDEGRSFHAHGQRIVDAVDQAEASVISPTGVPRGVLRLSAPHAFGQRVIMPFIEKFLAQWPGVQIEASFSDRLVDVVEEGFDLVIRFGGTAVDSRLVSRVLARDRYLIVASADYISRHGKPNSLDELASHQCLSFSSRGNRQRWRFADSGGHWFTAQVRTRLRLDSGEALHNAVARDLGIALLPSFLVGQDVDSGRFIHILPKITTETVEISVIYPDRRLLDPRVRQFVDLLATGLQF
ncbi:LysR family transcriptional regulator [Phyllobacterium sp. YR531]|uniref:LysR family transcriptional regulator n=1 Tax=Phyllobacterium sp. YR531 TaxID=1144343 RepID=UPI00026F9875|nr:LysR family transcriptional regulator [Phyllobacterium sp. YR531]EJN05347.1 transcriptional regulator [Phyllobacterium sp. YR531]